MQTHAATIVAVHGKQLTVSVENRVTCARCATGKGCGAGLLGGKSGPLLLELDAPVGTTLRSGDVVRLNMESRDLLRASWLAYGLPMVSVVLALGMLRLAVPGASDAVAIVTASAALGASLVAARTWLRRRGCMKNLVPTVSSGMVGGE